MLDIIHTVESSQLSLTSLLLGITAITCLLSVFFCLRGSKKNRLLEMKLAKLERDLRIANNSALAMGQDIIGLEKRVHAHTSHATAAGTKNQASAASPVPNRATPSTPTENYSSNKTTVLDEESVYDEARKLLAEGVGIQEIAKRSGLSYAEVSLLDTLSKSSATNSY